MVYGLWFMVYGLWFYGLGFRILGVGLPEHPLALLFAWGRPGERFRRCFVLLLLILVLLV